MVNAECKSPSGFQQRSTGRGLETKSPETEAICRHGLHILTEETTKI